MNIFEKLRSTWGQNILLWMRLHRPILQQHNVTATDKRILYGLSNHSGISKNQLAKEIVLTESSLTRSLDRLEKQNLIQRLTDKDDKRFVELKLTPQGITKVKAIKKSALQLLKTASTNIKEEDLQTTLDVMTKLNKAWLSQIET